MGKLRMKSQKTKRLLRVVDLRQMREEAGLIVKGDHRFALNGSNYPEMKGGV